ncbi:DUF2155 domain-containing protein [Pseudorhodobacter sp. MZDSW-24AT]|uniref:DUF2155 domain-containing protein n=1 Tax=Pseudorhodobacter sp. MZDSW-24AT TaxID=2052957 RepID=UPI000C1F3AB4|nr:DUF2155 domain-containing protein [Pseudorhodobacter sp. MZDSW-24AT]PJF08278.1 DUF2155 domain-containing protein [Pseudorhodobacter sp. MZDSW-24AT]
MKRLCLALMLLAPGLAAAQEMDSAPGGTLRFLDKVTGRVADLSMSRGETVQLGRLTVLLDECRFPRDNPAADAQAHLTVVETEAAQTMFSGWMLASSPALSAMDHPRYDIWVLSCDSGFVAPEVTEPDPSDEPLEEINEG